jgi:hypothetical protein
MARLEGGREGGERLREENGFASCAGRKRRGEGQDDMGAVRCRDLWAPMG